LLLGTGVYVVPNTTYLLLYLNSVFSNIFTMSTEGGASSDHEEESESEYESGSEYEEYYEEVEVVTDDEEELVTDDEVEVVTDDEVEVVTDDEVEVASDDEVELVTDDEVEVSSEDEDGEVEVASEDEDGEEEPDDGEQEAGREEEAEEPESEPEPEPENKSEPEPEKELEPEPEPEPPTKVNHQRRVEQKQDKEEEEGTLWEKPAWATGGFKLKNTSKGDKLRNSGNLDAPITFSPFKSQDHSNKVANQTRLRTTDGGAALKDGEDLAAPITFTPYKSDDHRNRLANPEKLRASDIGAAVKSGENLAAVRIDSSSQSSFFNSRRNIANRFRRSFVTQPITYTPFKNTDHTNYVANPNKLKTTEEGELVKKGENLAAVSLLIFPSVPLVSIGRVFHTYITILSFETLPPSSTAHHAHSQGQEEEKGEKEKCRGCRCSRVEASPYLVQILSGHTFWHLQEDPSKLTRK
jgi:hypothetical protein